MSALTTWPLLASALLACSGAPAAQASTEPAVTSDHRRDVGDSVRDRLIAAYALAGPGAITEAPRRKAALIGAVIRQRANPMLMTGAVDVAERNYLFTPADGMGRHVGLFAIRYRNVMAARKAADRIAGQRRFRSGIILTPMASAHRDTTVVVVFSESGNDPKIAGLLAAIASAPATPR